MKTIKISLLFFLLLIILSCKKDKDEEEIIIQPGLIKLEVNSSEPIKISNPGFVIQVYGFFPSFQDVPATLITSQRVNSNQLPFTLIMAIPENAEDLIKFNNHSESAMYYLHIFWDSDDNGKICNGDLAIDFNNNFPYIFIDKTEIQTINLFPIHSLSCE